MGGDADLMDDRGDHGLNVHITGSLSGSDGRPCFLAAVSDLVDAVRYGLQVAGLEHKIAGTQI